ncbi:MAG: multiubiquitin domain-containing protein [Sphingopyxis sp.]
MDTHNHPRDRKDDDPEIVIINNRTDADVDVEIKHENGHDIVIVDIVDVEECGRANQTPPHAHRYKVKIDHIYRVFDRRFVTGREILVAGGKTPIEKYELEKRLHGGHYVSIGVDEKVDLGECGIEVFETFPLDETEG